jgi:SAM-dependent methyltransferase
MTAPPSDQNERIAKEWRQYDARYLRNVRRPFLYHYPNDGAFLDALIARYDIPREAKLLDVGCGNGYYSQLFKHRGLSVTGVDLSPTAISLFKETFGNDANGFAKAPSRWTAPRRMTLRSAITSPTSTHSTTVSKRERVRSG